MDVSSADVNADIDVDLYIVNLRNPSMTSNRRVNYGIKF